MSTAQITAFSGRLQKVLRKTKPENMVYSPLGVTFCSSMAYIGAVGNTKREMETSMGYPANQENPFPSNLIKLLNENVDDSITFQTAQQVFIQKGYEVLPEYLEKLKQMDAGVGQIDDEEAQRSCNEVNAWVRKATNGKIQEIVTRDKFDNDLTLFLINCIYFHGKWEVEFPIENTKPRDFFFDNGEVANVPMMTLQKCQLNVDYVECQKLKAEIVKLPYKGERFCMIVFIPNTKNDLTTIEEGLLTMSVNEYLEELDGYKDIVEGCILNVTLPKFEFETNLDLMEPLQQLGIKDAFDMEEADFSEITDDPFGLYISSIIQRAMVQVDEEGTTAVAATGGGGKRKASSIKKDIIDVVADHPFYFQIIEQNMQIILFSGVVSDPRQKS